MYNCYNAQQEYDPNNILSVCCDSCHEDDEEYNIDLCYIEIENKEYYVCCKMKEFLTKLKLCK